MADAAVEGLLEKIRHLLIHNVNLFMDVKPQLEKLETDLRVSKALLKELTSGTKNGHLQQEFLIQIRNVIYEAEDLLDDYTYQVFNYGTMNFFLSTVNRRHALLNFCKQVENVTAKLTHIISYNWRSSIQEVELERDEEMTASAVARVNNVVGFEDEKEKLIGYLTETTEHLDVISIVGMPGLGKTTLAMKIFMDPNVMSKFRTRIWIHVSNNLRDVYKATLRQLEQNTDDLNPKISDIELAREVFRHLESSKFLMVMDDVRSANDWERLERILPKLNMMGKVLITTCNEEVGRRANVYRLPHKLRFLTPMESWELLELEVFGRAEGCPTELQMIGKLIATQCEGLPLAVVTMGVNLSTKYQRTENAWSKASKEVPAFSYQSFYDDLPNSLKVCFLYLAMLPPDFEIPAKQLIQMWIAEGFIIKSRDSTLEETGEDYLNTLITRNLVLADRIGVNGKIKTCRIHGMMLEFCKTQAGKEKENVLEEIKSQGGVFEPRISELTSYRRLCIHSNVSGFFSSEPYCPLVRSFISFSADEIHLPRQNGAAVPTAFKLVRVLEIKPITFSKIVANMYRLVHLRYLTLSVTMSVLPPAFSRIRNLQTLIVVTTSRTLDIKFDILKLIELRHFKTNVSAILSKPGKIEVDQGGENLQTLGMISVQSCTDQVLSMVRNLKKLGIRGQLSKLFDEGSFDSLGRVMSLEKLKLINDVSPMPSSEGHVHLPSAYKFPPGLRSLTLASTYLEWSQMSVLGSLENLQVLKLKDKAFVGQSWKTDNGGFCRLEALQIDHTDLVNWVTSAYHFPILARLELRNCEKLREVPIELADVPSLLHLELYRSNRAAASATKISEKRHKYLEGLNKKDRVFKLSIISS